MERTAKMEDLEVQGQRAQEAHRSSFLVGMEKNSKQRKKLQMKKTHDL